MRLGGVDMFGGMFETYEVTFEIYIEDKLVNKQAIQSPKEMLMMNFIQTVRQLSNDKRPMKIKMIAPNTIWDNFEKKQKVLNNEVEFSNNAMVAWEKDKQEEGE